MNAEELKSWVQRAADRFPQIAQLFERAADRDDLAASWSMALGEVSLSDGNRYLDAMLRGDVETPEYLGDWAKLPAMLRRWLRENRALVGSLEPHWTPQKSYACRRCWDKGYGVEVFNPTWIRYHSAEIELGELPTGWQREARRWCKDQSCGPHTFSIHCDCPKGSHMVSVRRQPEQQFDERVHCEVPPGGERHWAAHLTEWVKAHPVLESNVWQPLPAPE